MRLATSLSVLLLPLAAQVNTSQAAVQEEVLVTGRKQVLGDSGDSLSFISITDASQVAAPPQTIAELAVSQPGVAYTGQGGLFQTLAIRGLSRDRVGSFYLDIPLLTERRAGTAASFVDPFMLQDLQIIRGPATTHYGSGNLAGVIALRPRQTAGLDVQMGVGSAGNENHQALGWGSDSGQVAFSHRGADDTKSAAGADLHTGFDQYNLMLGGQQQRSGLTITANTLLSYAEDIGKSNNLYPHQRITEYPRERHWLGQVGVARAEETQGSLFFHYQDLETSVERIESRLNEVENESLDLGGHFTKQLVSGVTDVRWGLDYLARLDVEADEQETQYSSGDVSTRENLSGDQHEAAVFGDVSWTFAQWQLAGGLRGTYRRQNADGWSSESLGFVSGFVGASRTIGDGARFNIELARGDRAPNLSERYFRGTTGRGVVLGNPDLDRETATSLDVGFIWEWQSLDMELHGFYQDIDDFIERIEVTPETFSFRNINSGEIYGAEIVAQWQLTERWRLSTSGQYQDSEDAAGNQIQDVSANRATLGLRYQHTVWLGQLDYQYRFSRSDVAAGELPLDSAALLAARLSWQFSSNLTLGLWGRNLLDEEYRISADDLSTEGVERSVGVELSWRS